MIPLKIQLQKHDQKLAKFDLNKLLPPKEALEIQWTQQQLFKMVQKKKKRRIYFGVQYNAEQKKHIENLKQQLLSKNIPNLFHDPVLLKHLYFTDFNYSKCIERFKIIIQFFNKQEETQFTEDTVKGLEKGFIYCYSKDKKYRPVIIFRIDKFNFDNPKEFLNVLYFNLYIAQRFRMIPYHVEKWNLMFDVNGMSVTQIPYMKLHDIMIKIGMIYTGNVQKTIIINGQNIGALWNVAKLFIPTHALQNIVFAKSNSQLHEFIDPSQLQQRYGGTNPDLTTFWPPSLPKSDHKVTEQEINETLYMSILNDHLYFEETELTDKQQHCNCNCEIF